jgi:general secretion pathway protein M
MTLALPTQVRDFWDEIAPRERALISLGLLVLLPLGLYLYFWQPMNSERTRLTQRVEQVRSELAQLRADSEEIKLLRAQAPIRSAQTLEASARLAAARFGLADSISSLTQQTGDRLNVEMEAAGFDAWLRWVGELGVQGIQLAACKVEALPTPGLVRVKATLTRTRS